MRQLGGMVWVVCAVLWANPASAGDDDPPSARRVDAADNAFGLSLPDPYHWLGHGEKIRLCHSYRSASLTSAAPVGVGGYPLHEHANAQCQYTASQGRKVQVEPPQKP